MTSEALTIGETITAMHSTLEEYIEATYHISDPALVGQRKELLDREGVLFRAPYIESTPKYVPGCHFSELELPPAAHQLLNAMAHPSEGSPLIHDPPYIHQARALEVAASDGFSFILTTGTGSGKTEAFLLPILAKLAVEASESPASFHQASLRAILLYPMNALVNDQLGRLRLMLGDARVSSIFTNWAGRPARFARYTSRTLYPGVRSRKKDQDRLKPIEDFYVALLHEAGDETSPRHDHAKALISNLQKKGKWPAKPQLEEWFGRSGQRWQNREGRFIRAVMRPNDPELLTRHEVLDNPPDILVTNYSMLEYMLMRPLERPIFDSTKEWLAAHPEQRLLIVVDEAHLYRGASGAEVGLLLRRLRTRLGIEPDRLQAICTSASFKNQEHARTFAAQLTGKTLDSFRAVEGELDPRPDARKGSAADARLLASIPLGSFYEANDDAARLRAVSDFLAYRQVHEPDGIGPALYRALQDFPPMSLLVNATMSKALPIAELANVIFDGADDTVGERAVTALAALGSIARRVDGEPGLLPCRVHAFFRGLPGLWACADADCKVRNAAYSGSPIGLLYPQPQDTCECGARVFELFTCRRCGSAYLRAYTNDIETPSFLWNEPGGSFEAVGGRIGGLLPIDILIEQPTTVAVEPAELDLLTGRLNPMKVGSRTREVFLKRDRTGATDEDDEEGDADSLTAGEFKPCGVCGEHAPYGRSSVQDHQTKGDQPFQALVTRQIDVQPPSQPFTDFAPLQGRKVLAFSDSRQTAARLAPNLQTYSMRDLLRPLILRGWRELAAIEMLAPSMSLHDLFLATLVGAKVLRIRLRTELKAGESMHALDEVSAALDRGALRDPAELMQLITVRATPPPQSLLRGIVATITDRFYGLQSLALASVRERMNLSSTIDRLPNIPGRAETAEQKTALLRTWISQWAAPAPGIWFQSMNPSWWRQRGGVTFHTGKFARLTRWIGEKESNRIFEREWLPLLFQAFCELTAPGKYRILASSVGLELEGSWGYCGDCRTTQRPFPGTAKCVNCSHDAVAVIDPESDPVFAARKRYYRGSAVRALADPPHFPLAIVAAEHTAQLNAAQADEVFSKAEEHELLFQDINISRDEPGEQPKTAIDVLSSTTTMEVGIDIGTLSGVALRNMPPSRASYQQRSGRAGRRGNAIATVMAFGSADTHDEHYFLEPDAMIRGDVVDPVLTLDNAEIAQRHVSAYLFQRYHEARLPDIDPEQQPQLFEVLGSVSAFESHDAPLNREDFGCWLRENESELTREIDSWLPSELAHGDRQELLASYIERTLAAVDSALAGEGSESMVPEPVVSDGGTEDATVTEAPAEEGEERSDPRREVENLLDRLLYKGVLPRYAFPTDVVSFFVFDRERSTRFRAAFLYSPQQGLPVALSQYAPGKRVWIDGKEWRSGAIYSPIRQDRIKAWRDRKLYFECSVCHYAATERSEPGGRGERRDCPACGGKGTFGGAKNWMRPPGFAHPTREEEETSAEDQPARSYATRAKLVASGPTEAASWTVITPRIREHSSRRPLLVTNSGPRQEGYSYCTLCGLIEPTAVPSTTLAAPHARPYPDERNPTCPGGATTRGLVLGTDFYSDVLLISLRVDEPLTLRPGVLATDVALRTLSEAITLAATDLLQIESGELQAEYRPALTQYGHMGLEAEIYVYDTLAGGAGFARRVGDQRVLVFERALERLESCPANCDRSCYRCLRSFKNRFEHMLLDRHLGASLLRYLVRDEEPVLGDGAISRAVERLFADLARHGVGDVEFAEGVDVEIPGIGRVRAPILATINGKSTIVGIHGPLTPDHASDAALRDAKEFGTEVPVVLVDELVVSRNLPRASQLVLDRL